MCKHTCEQVPNALRALHELAYGGSHHLIDGFVKTDHLLEGCLVELTLMLPSAQDTRSQRTVFRHQRIDLKT